MVFSSLWFLYAFLPASLVCYALCRSLRAKNLCLLVFSLVFYAWGEPKYVLLLALMALFDWYFALRIARAKGEHRRGKGALVLACVVDLGLIGFFKYSGMVCSLFGEVPAFAENIALPIGISFYTFQLLTYVVDVYRGEAEAEAEYWHVLLYAALFHQCIAGPIVRYKTVARELFVRRDWHTDAVSGIRRFTVGLGKKVLLANPWGALADSVLLTDSTIADASARAENLLHLSGASALELWLGVIAFFFQIYFDFSAYSDMAIGLGRMLGLHYTENFDHPYVSRSVTEFWRRWHISLGTFFRDYVYIPLGGNRNGRGRTLRNLFIVWALTGLWHGASWNFVLWGLYFFLLQTMERLFLQKTLDRLPKAVGQVVSRAYLLLAVLLGWVLFKYTDLSLAWTVLRGLFGGNGNPASDFYAVIELKSHMYLLLVSALCATPLFSHLGSLWERRGERCAAARVSFTVTADMLLPAASLLLSTAALVGNSYNPFLYFKF